MKTLMAALILLALPVAIASAQPGGGGMMERLRAVDLNGDGAITKVEARTARETAFRALDTNNDGFVTDAEKAAISDGAAKKRPGREGAGGGAGAGGGGDTNGDGKISRDEFMNAPYRAFQRLDVNRNDTIDASELETARTMMLQRKQGTP